MNDKFSYPVSLTKQRDGGFMAKFPDFSEAVTQGDTVEATLEEAIDCLEEAIANRVAMKLTIPKPSKVKPKQYTITVSAIFAAKWALYDIIKERKWTNVQLAKKMNCDEKEIRRLLDLHYHSKFPKIELALHCLGKRLRVEVISL